MRRSMLAAATAWMVAGCYHGIDFDPAASGDQADAGGDGADDGDDSEPEPDEPEPEIDPSTFAELVGPSGVRRLTAIEYAASVRDLVGDDAPEAVTLLPEDPRTPYDNDFTVQVASQALIEAAELLAADASGRLLEDRERLDALVGCTAVGPDDATCFSAFVDRFGRRAFRRPLTTEEHEALASLQDLAVEADDFAIGAAAVVRAVLQHPKFLYRIEIGTPVGEGLFALDGFEVASRLSYLLTGSTPDEWLLDAAEAGDLAAETGIRDAAQELLADPRTRARIARFHALWIGYESLPFGGELAASMQAETEAAIERVIFEEDRPWQDLLRLEETFVDADLAAIYGLPAPSEPSWVRYDDPKRKGLLGQASFLSAGTDGLTTSPTQRGLLVRTRLFCQDVPDPPPNVDADEPAAPEGAVCKVEILSAHGQGGCAGCHQLIDPIGFGLENYGPDGGYLTAEPDHPECVIEGNGEIVGVGEFSGPAELADLMLGTDSLNGCVATQLYRFTMGRYELDDFDEAFVDALMEDFGSGDFRFADLVLDMVGNPAFRHRREEKE